MDNKISIKEQGSANEYAMLSHEGRWVACVRMQGEWMPARQRQFMAAFAAALATTENLTEVEVAGYEQEILLDRQIKQALRDHNNELKKHIEALINCADGNRDMPEIRAARKALKTKI